MQRIPEEFIEQVKDANAIQDVVGEYVQYVNKSGTNLFACCPFHAEKTASFSVAPHKNIFYCFGCQAGGDVIQFISKMEHLSYKEAVLFLAKRAGLPLPVLESSDEEEKKEKERKKLKQYNALAANFFFSELRSKQGELARKYLKKRGVKAKAVQDFALGYASETWQSLENHFHTQLKNNYNEEALLSLGLLKKNEKGKTYDAFRDRLIFPIVDVHGQVLGFGGRRLSDLDENQTEAMNPKYLNSPETPIYHKGSHLYGLNLAKKSKENKILLLEGYLDVISAHSAGVDYAVGVLGTSLTDQQLKLLKRYTQELILGFDADEAGKKASLRALSMLKKYDFKVSLLVLPDQKDVDAYIQAHGEELFKNLLKKTKSPLDYFYDLYKKECTVEGEFLVYDFAKKMIELLVEMDISSIQRDAYLQKLASEGRLAFSSLLEDFKRCAKEQKSSKNFSKTVFTKPALAFTPKTKLALNQDLFTENAPYFKEEILILHLLIHYDYVLEKHPFLKLSLGDFSSPSMRNFVKEMFSQEKQSFSFYLEKAEKLIFRNGNLKAALLSLEMEIGRQKVDYEAYLVALAKLKLKRLSEQLHFLSQKTEMTNEEQQKVSELFKKRKELQEFLVEIQQNK